LKELGIDPPRSRRYLLRWREKFRNRQFGIGGDFKFVKDGVAELRVAEIPVSGHRSATATLSPGKRKIVVNVAAGGSASGNLLEKCVPVKGIQIKGAHTIVGPHVQPVKGGNGARIVIKEGLWEERRGHKIDGGERRQAEVRAKKRGEEKRAR
jgi:putative component of toxin-antitoxin plasmid stabilization module